MLRLLFYVMCFLSHDHSNVSALQCCCTKKKFFYAEINPIYFNIIFLILYKIIYF